MKYRKRPLVIDAEPYEPGRESAQRVCTQACQPFTPGMSPPPSPHIHVGTGMQWLAPGDYIITDGDGRYVCPKALFAELYEDYVPDPALEPSVYDEAERLIKEAEANKGVDADGPSLDADSH